MTVIRGLALGGLILSVLGCSTATDQVAAPSVSRVAVTFVHPERFTDVSDRLLPSPKGTADLLVEIDRYLHAAGDRSLPADLTLEILITDVDMAGEFGPGRAPQFDRIRIMRDVDPPRVELEFRLRDADGAIVKEGVRSLTDSLYLTGAAVVDHPEGSVGRGGRAALTRPSP